MWAVLCWIGLFFASTFACCCDQQWNKTPNDMNVNTFINKTMPDQYEMLTWQWINEYKDGIWTVSLKHWPKLEFATGSMKFRNLITNVESYLGWKVKKNYLTWSAKKGALFQPAWNLSICNINVELSFMPERFGLWSFRLGNVSMTGEVGSSNIKQIENKQCAKKRTKRAPEDDAEEMPDDEGDGTQRKSFIKWILRKTGLEQGDESDKTWREYLENLFASWLTIIAAKMYKNFLNN